MDRREILDFASPDALGLAGDPRIAAAMRRGGAADVRQPLERELAAMLGRPSATIVRTSDTVARSLAAARLRPGAVAIVETAAPSCWLDGIRAAGAEVATFPRHDTATLDRTLRMHGSPPVVVVEGVSSLDGDVAELRAVLDACEAHGARVIVDETHGAFALGPRGAGVTAMLGQSRRVGVVAGVYSAAPGTAAGFVSALEDESRDVPGTDTELPLSHLAGLLMAVRVALDEADRRDRLTASAAYFRTELQTMRLDTGRSSTHVIPILVRSRDRWTTAAEHLNARRLAFTTVDAAAAPDGVPRLLVTISSSHTRAQMDRALAIIEDVLATP